MSGDLYSRIPLVPHASGLSSRRNSWTASTKCTAIISARVPSAFRTHSNSPPTKRQARAKKFEHHKPGAIAQKSCYSTEDLSLIELPNVQCNKPHGASSTKQQPALHEIRLSYPTTMRNVPKILSIRSVHFHFRSDRALRSPELNSIEARKPSNFQPDDFNGLIPEVTASHVHRPRNQTHDSFISPNMSFTKRYAAKKKKKKKHLYPKHTSHPPTSFHAEKTAQR